MSDYTDDQLRQWALAMETPLHKVGYASESQAYRAMTEGPHGMLSKGPVSDGGMYHAMKHLRDLVRQDAEVHRVNQVISRMPRDYKALIRVAYLERPGHVTPRRIAAEKLGVTERKYRDQWNAMHAYIEGALSIVA